jgi:hypothetical protein
VALSSDQAPNPSNHRKTSLSVSNIPPVLPTPFYLNLPPYSAEQTAQPLYKPAFGTQVTTVHPSHAGALLAVDLDWSKAMAPVRLVCFAFHAVGFQETQSTSAPYRSRIDRAIESRHQETTKEPLSLQLSIYTHQSYHRIIYESTKYSVKRQSERLLSKEVAHYSSVIRISPETTQVFLRQPQPLAVAVFHRFRLRFLQRGVRTSNKTASIGFPSYRSNRASKAARSVQSRSFVLNASLCFLIASATRFEK